MTVPSEASSGVSTTSWLFKNKEHGNAGAAASLIRSKLMPILSDEKSSLDVIEFTEISLGLVYVGSCNEEVGQTIVFALMDRSEQLDLEPRMLVWRIQHFLGQCAQHLEKGETYQGPAVLGIALLAMAEELGPEVAIRSLERLLQYREQNIRRAVPLALGLLCMSNPKGKISSEVAVVVVVVCKVSKTSVWNESMSNAESGKYIDVRLLMWQLAIN
ncbi:hypothetical protein Pfo_022473 [Paulownia fortunei]|nr:hypothetical protein Pfo_022473 [Paulownia fortunei]